ncbi:MAG: zf-HC2 domain-containing protein [Acidobacteria bacterium]|nr:zf-HC2 domain-containing protein [Acidobacteriota bacterium]
MTAHMSKQQMEKFCARILQAPEMVAIAEHLSDCASCQLQFHETFQRRRNFAPVTIDLSPHFWFKDDHLEYEQMVGMVENTLDDEDREIIDIHLETCARCREDLRSFREFVRQIEPAIRASHLPENRKTFTWWKWPAIEWKYGYVAAVVIIIGLVTLIAIFFVRGGIGRRLIPDNASSPTNTVTPPPSAVTSASPQTAATIEQPGSQDKGLPHSSPEQVRQKDDQARGSGIRSTRPHQAAMLSLNDSGRKILIERAGGISGLDKLPPSVRKSVNEALLSNDINKPDVLDEIIVGSSALRGASGDASPFKLISPNKTVLEENHPVFCWEPLKGARSYQVHISALGSREVLSSAKLSSNATQWVPETPLKRGAVYKWAVTAIVNGEEISSPAAPAPEARFGILDEEKLLELNQVKKASSHLALGVFCARAGMIVEAEREFQFLVEDNPQSQIAIKLLRRIQSWR